MLRKYLTLSRHNAIRLWAILVVVVVLGIFFLRLYRLPEYLMFLSDQGRDAIVLKRLVTLEKLVFVGPTTSIGNVFTGPFYYYLVAPFMLLWGLHPVGPAYGIALINSIGLVAVFLYLQKLFGKSIGLLFLLLTGFSATQVWQSRYSWNPNPLPLFTMLTLIAWHQALHTRRIIFVVLTGVLFGLSLQLHYIAIVLLVPIGYSLVHMLISRQWKGTHSLILHLKTGVLQFGAGIGGFILTFTPLILFEIKNSFINTQTLMRALSAGEVQARNSVYIDRLKDTCAGFVQHLLLIEVNRDIALAGIIIFFTAIVLLSATDTRSRRTWIRWALLLIAANIFALSRLETGRHVHYFNPSYWAAYLLIAYTAMRIIQLILHARPVATNAWRRHALIVCLGLILLIGLDEYARRQIQSLYFLTDPPKSHTQISHAKRVAQHIINEANTNDFQVVGLPFYETEGHYRFFIEYLGKRPLPAEAIGDPRELFVICHELNKVNCDIPGNPQWQIADFQNRHPNWRVADVTQVEEVRVYKLVY